MILNYVYFSKVIEKVFYFIIGYLYTVSKTYFLLLLKLRSGIDGVDS